VHARTRFERGQSARATRGGRPHLPDRAAAPARL